MNGGPSALGWLVLGKMGRPLSVSTPGMSLRIHVSIISPFCHMVNSLATLFDYQYDWITTIPI